MLDTILSLMAINNLSAPLPGSNTETVNIPEPSYIVAYAEKSTTSLGPDLDAKAILSLDLETGKILYEKNPAEKLPMASLTKLMTMMVIMDEHGLDEVVTVDKRATIVEPSKINLLSGEKITVRNLVKAMIIKSANDAALALAYFDSEEVEVFADKMNKKAKELGMNSTNFVNPIGFDDPNQYSTTDDLAILARKIYKIPLVRETATIKETSLNSVDNEQSHSVQSTNALLDSYLKTLGLKTGTTDEAGQCLISIIESPEGNKIMNIMLGSPARFSESKIISQWIFDNYKWI